MRGEGKDKGDKGNKRDKEATPIQNIKFSHPRSSTPDASSRGTRPTNWLLLAPC
ncbi:MULTISPECIES: hypothetical protein [Chroococcidiopsis]|uniref:hypothetical protein n=1 Tax=Chroococcidiopsis TaxID=54298 RepID=UPI0002E3D3A4|nr:MULTISPECIES: hypothetical protein [Chroococcidiopsis]URD51038.1 hypothetical protein M5J74_03410 [Chroococcidiopsis sp. CCNUC1]